MAEIMKANFEAEVNYRLKTTSLLIEVPFDRKSIRSYWDSARIPIGKGVSRLHQLVQRVLF